MNEHGLEILSPVQCETPYTISQINQGISDRIESGNTVVWFTGEISNFKLQPGSGHCYLKLKDAQSQIPAVIWNSNASRLKFRPEDGMEVTGVASIRVYKKGGYYQLDILKLQPSGLGALFAAFEALKKKLAAEGLFDEEHKKPIPSLVENLGVITSKSGAAVRDIIRVISNRSPQTTIIIYNVAVQGQDAAPQIAQAIKDFNTWGNVDCMIVGRGGGSIEDLWAFNEEVVARAIYESKIPIISAVGHETDFTIADFVADLRAPTPSAAAEMAVADVAETHRYFISLANRVVNGYLGYFQDQQYAFDNLVSRPCLREPFTIIIDARENLKDQTKRCSTAMANVLKNYANRLTSASLRLQSLNPLNVLSRGYSVVTKTDGTVVKSSLQVKKGDSVSIRFSKGCAHADISHSED